MFALFIQEQEQTTSKPKDKGDNVNIYKRLHVYTVYSRTRTNN